MREDMYVNNGGGESAIKTTSILELVYPYRLLPHPSDNGFIE